MSADDGSRAEADAAPITIVLADDHEVVRDGLRMLLDAEPGLEVIAEASDVGSVERKVRGHRPRILVLDINLEGESSLSLIPALIADSPETAIVVLTMQDDPAFAREALAGGSKGFVVKHSAKSELVTAIKEVAAGRTYINPQLGARIAAQPAEDERPDGLTEREVEVLGLIALGNTNPQIAEKLFLSVRTVETHRANAQRKAGLASRSELVAYARENDLVPG